jgi:hypothetical protein
MWLDLRLVEGHESILVAKAAKTLASGHAPNSLRPVGGFRSTGPSGACTNVARSLHGCFRVLTAPKTSVPLPPSSCTTGRASL